MLNISVNKIAVNFGNNAVSKPQLKLKPALSADVFVKSSPSAPKLYAVPYTKPVSFKGQTVDSISRAVKFGSPFSTPLIQRYDGGYLVDSSTNTVVYYGKDAKNYLKDMTHFPLETQIIAQSDTEIEVETMQGKKINLDEPGAILINKDTFAKVKVKKGNPLVITTQNTPPWFQKMSAERQDYFNTLVGKNKNAFDTNHPTQNPGTALRKDFEACPDWVFDKLCEKKILIKDESDTNKAKWASFRTVDEFQEDLWNKAEIYGDVKDRIVDTYKKTTKAGYDFTGLKDSADGVTVYVGKDRFNLFNSNPTEWLSSSITWGDKGTFGIGVSRVARQGSSEITDFNEIRPSEKIHKHQNPQYSFSIK